MLSDFSLVIPTYNRQQQVKALLSYLRDVPVPIYVLDSSEPHLTSAELAGWQINHVKYPSDYHPFEKFAEGLNRVKTTFVAICADDDVMYPDGLASCVEALRDNPKAVCARGHSGSFEWKEDIIHISAAVVTPPAITGDSPMVRLASVFRDYHACIYGVYRTATLQRALQAAKPQDTLLGCEAMVAAITAIEGEILAVPKRVHMRSMGKSVFPYKNWHPLEMWVSDFVALAQDYWRFATALHATIIAREDNHLTPREVERAINSIFLGYLLHNSPKECVDYIIDTKARGAKPEGHLPKELQQVLLQSSLAAGRYDMTDLERNAWMQDMAGYGGQAWQPVPETAADRVGEAWA